MNDSTDRRRRSIDVDLDYVRDRIERGHHCNPRGPFMRIRWDQTTGTAGAGLRVSDAERNEVAERLSRHYADGRLDQVEFKERLDTAMAAKTRGDLTGLFDDLPPLPAAPVPHRSRRRHRLVPFLLLLVVLAATAGTTLPFVHGLHLTWLLIGLAGLYFWSRSAGDRRRRRKEEAS